MSESDQPAVHAQDRERVDPEERIRPMPILPAVIAVGMVLFGIIYIINSGPYTNPALGDHRTLADLRPQAAGGGAGGGAVDGGAIFAANCVACHQATGAGLPGAFPPLKGDPVVMDPDPTRQIHTVLHGLQGQAIGGTTYPSPMPGFASTLNDHQIADIINHERTSWGNQAKQITADQVKAERAKSP